MNSLFSYKLPQLPLIKQNRFRFPRTSPALASPKEVPGVWPQNFNPLWRATAPFRLPLKSFAFYVPFQRYYPFPSPTNGCLFRLQTYLFVYWFEFHLNKYSIILDLGTKEKLSFSDTFLWNRRSFGRHSSFLSFWSFYQRTFSFSPLSPSFFLLNSNQNSPYFPLSSLRLSSFWFEDNLANVRLSGWSFYSRLSSTSLNVTLSQSIFDSRALQRQSPWSSANLWLSSSIHDYSLLVSTFFSINQVVMPERFFQFTKNQGFSSLFWSQLLSQFWKTFSKIHSSFFFSSLFSSFSRPLTFYFYLRLLGKKTSNPLFFRNFFGFKFFDPFLSRSSSVVYGSSSLPFISQQVDSGSSVSPWNAISAFPNNSLYLRYLRRHFCFSPFFVNYSLCLEERLLDLNFFFSFFFQSHTFHSSMQFYQVLFLWFFFLSEVSVTLSKSVHSATITFNN